MCYKKGIDCGNGDLWNNSYSNVNNRPGHLPQQTGNTQTGQRAKQMTYEKRIKLEIQLGDAGFILQKSYFCSQN